jgi:HAD superfamily hydrolase (TIGR01509 family)
MLEKLFHQPKAIIFDMDGLMLDTEPIYRMAWQTAVAEVGYTISDELYLTFVGRKDDDCEVVLQQMWGDAFPKAHCRQRIVELWKQHVRLEGIPKKPGLTELLAFLDEQCIPKAVATSTEREQALQSLGELVDCFAAIATGDEVAQGKPAPDIFLLASRRLQIQPTDCLVLEDSEAGIQAAQAAGMAAILIPDLKQPQNSTTPICASLHEVQALLQAS